MNENTLTAVLVAASVACIPLQCPLWMTITFLVIACLRANIIRKL